MLPSIYTMTQDWFHWAGFWWYNYTGSQLVAGANKVTFVDLQHLPTGCYLARAKLISDDNNPYDDVSYVIFWVVL
jgi:hypothetical protein